MFFDITHAKIPFYGLQNTNASSYEDSFLIGNWILSHINTLYSILGIVHLHFSINISFK